MTTLKEEISNHTSFQPFSKNIEHIHLLERLENFFQKLYRQAPICSDILNKPLQVIHKERMKFKEELKITKLDVTKVRETSQIQEAELSNMIQDINKLRKLKIKLAFENVSLKESVDTLKSKVEKLEADHGNATMEKVSFIESLANYKRKAKKLENS